MIAFAPWFDIKRKKEHLLKDFFPLSRIRKKIFRFVFNFNINIFKFWTFLNKNYSFNLTKRTTIMDSLIFSVYAHLCCKNSATVLKTYFESIFSKLTSIPNWIKCVFLKRHCYSCVMYNFSFCKKNSIRYIPRKIISTSFFLFFWSTEELL